MRKYNCSKDNFLIMMNDKAYCFDIDKIQEICFSRGDRQVTDTKITDVSTLDEESNNGMFVTQKVIEENKYLNTQIDVLMQDTVKMFIIKLLESPIEVDENGDMDFSTALAFNSCLKWGIIKEIK